jgi:serine/threonine protein kinase
VQAAELGSKGNLVAVKVIPWEKRSNLLVEREVEFLSTLHHPNIVTFFGVSHCEASRELLMVQELCAGGNMRSAMRNKRAFLSERYWSLVLQITSAMEYLHGQGVIHRDLKPENVLLGGYGGETCKLCDFGLARCVKGDGRSFMTLGVGTIVYMAPETICDRRLSSAVVVATDGPEGGGGGGGGGAGQVITVKTGAPALRATVDGVKCDVYSASILFLEMFYPHMKLYDAMGPVALTLRMKEDPTTRPAVPEGTPKALAALLQTMWAPNPRERPDFAEIRAIVSTMAQAHGGG